MNRIKELLINCYLDNMSLEQAKSFIERCYCEKVSERQVSKAVEVIRNQYKKDWS